MSQMYKENINFKINRLINQKYFDNFKKIFPRNTEITPLEANHTSLRLL